MEKELKTLQHVRDFTGSMSTTQELSKEDFLNRLFLGIQRETKEPLIKKPVWGMEGLEAYLCVRLWGGAYFKIKSSFLASIGIDEDDAWTYAIGNVYAETVMESIKDILSELADFPTASYGDDAMDIQVITNQRWTLGAACILNHSELTRFAQRMEVSKLVVLPSSIHEMIVLPYTNTIDIDEMSNLVASINHTMVIKYERLTDRAYIIEV